MELLVLSATQSVVFLTIVVLLEVSLEPLAELEVVEVASFGQLGDVDVALNAVFVEGLLEHLVVLGVLVLVLGAPLDSGEGERSLVEGVEHGAVNGTSGALLNLGELQLKVRVEEVEDFLLAHEVGLVHHAD